MARWVKTESNGYANLDLATDIMISEDCEIKAFWPFMEGEVYACTLIKTFNSKKEAQEYLDFQMPPVLQGIILFYDYE